MAVLAQVPVAVGLWVASADAHLVDAASAVLALVLLGLLAMHGLVSAHHAPAAAKGHAPSAVAAQVADKPLLQLGWADPQQHDQVAAVARAATASAASLTRETVIGPAVPACDDDCATGVALLCAAIIAAAAAGAWLVAATARRRVLRAPARGVSWARAPARARRLLPGLDPVAELCVSRT